MPHRTLLGLIVLAALALLAPARAAGVHLARFQGDRAAALSLTFDDGLRDQLEQAVPLLDKYGFHATFFIVAGTVPDTDEEAGRKGLADFGGISWHLLKALAQAGHEIGNHSMTHGFLCDQDDAGLEKEVTQAAQRIAEKIGSAPLTFCYPGNGYDARVRQAVLRQHLFARETQYTYGGSHFTAPANAWIDDTIARGGWLVAMIHGITTGFAHFDRPAEFDEHLAYVKAHEKQLWVDTFANVGRYVRERDSATLTADLHAAAATLTLTCPLDPTRYTVPLTLVIPAPGVTNATAQRNGKPVPVTLRPDAILLDAVPSKDPVVVRWSVEK